MNKTTAKSLLAIFAMVWGAGLFCAKVLADSQDINGNRTIANDKADGDLNLNVNLGGTRVTVVKGVGATAAQAGGVHLGGSLSAANVNNPYNRLYGYLWSGGSGSGDDSGSIAIGANAYLGIQNSQKGRYSTATGGMALTLTGRTNDSNDALFFQANRVGQATTGIPADIIAKANQLGEWSFGILGSANNRVHRFNGGMQVTAPSTTFLEVFASGGTPSGYADLYLTARDSYESRIILQKWDGTTTSEKSRIYSNPTYPFAVTGTPLTGSAGDLLYFTASNGALYLPKANQCGNVCASNGILAQSNHTGAATGGTAMAADGAMWTRIGNVVNFSFTVTVITTGASTGTFQLALPSGNPSAFTAAQYAAGVCSDGLSQDMEAHIEAEPTDDRLLLKFFTSRVTTFTLRCTGSYTVQ